MKDQNSDKNVKPRPIPEAVRSSKYGGHKKKNKKVTCFKCKKQGHYSNECEEVSDSDDDDKSAKGKNHQIRTRKDLTL